MHRSVDPTPIAPPPVAARMAETMRERAAGGLACTAGDLRAAGFTSAEIAAHAGAAERLARRGLLRRTPGGRA